MMHSAFIGESRMHGKAEALGEGLSRHAPAVYTGDFSRKRELNVATDERVQIH